MLVKKYWIYTLSVVGIIFTTIIIASNAPTITKYEVLDEDRNYSQVAPTSTMLAQKCGPIFALQNPEGMVQEIPEEYYTTAGENAEPPSPPGLVPAFGYAAREGLTFEEITYYPYEENPDLYFSENTILRTMWDKDIVVIWYDPETVSEEDKETFSLLAETAAGQLLIIPWMNYEDSETLPLSRTIAYATIGITLSCEGFNINVLNEFRNYAIDNPKHVSGSEIPQGKPDYSLALPRIDETTNEEQSD